jgi:hypothetical protein
MERKGEKRRGENRKRVKTEHKCFHEGFFNIDAGPDSAKLNPSPDVSGGPRMPGSLAESRTGLMQTRRKRRKRKTRMKKRKTDIYTDDDICVDSI